MKRKKEAEIFLGKFCEITAIEFNQENLDATIAAIKEIRNVRFKEKRPKNISPKVNS